MTVLLAGAAPEVWLEKLPGRMNRGLIYILSTSTHISCPLYLTNTLFVAYVGKL
jgi:hypothetical protein